MERDPAATEPKPPQSAASAAPAPALRRPSAELWTRVLSGLVLAAVAFGLCWLGVLPFAALVLAVALAISWEWSRIVRGEDVDLVLILHGLAVAAACGLASAGLVALGVAVLVTGAIIVLALTFGSRPLLSATGVLYAGLPAVALLWLRADAPLGFSAILFIVLVVATTDTAAYASGRLIGGPRLAPRVSPNKTWSGLIGGVLGAAAVAGLFALALGTPPGPLALAGLLLGLISQAGDLAESALKRAFGVKDTSQLIPGHGGVMDRMDGLVAAAVAAALAALFIAPDAPARALLSGLAWTLP